VDGDDISPVLGEVFDWLMRHFDLSSMIAAGHRVVHGGDNFSGPALIDDHTLGVIRTLAPLAPLHQPQNLKLIDAVAKLLPDAAQIASFDTAFHQTQTESVRRYAIPRDLHDQGVKRYGFHGLSYKYIASLLKREEPAIGGGRVVVAHLGSGASLCAIDNGESRDCSMGYSTLDGIPMATRPGVLDPGLVLDLIARRGMSVGEVEDMFYHKSGLLGLSGISADSRVLLESDRSEAREALQIFASRIAGEIARLATSMGGLEGLVFTAGIGEHQPQIRANVCSHLGWIGMELNAVANTANRRHIHEQGSAIPVLVIPTDEEQVIADETMSVVTRHVI
jgi:acetate kinase